MWVVCLTPLKMPTLSIYPTAQGMLIWLTLRLKFRWGRLFLSKFSKNMEKLEVMNAMKTPMFWLSKFAYSVGQTSCFFLKSDEGLSKFYSGGLLSNMRFFHLNESCPFYSIFTQKEEFWREDGCQQAALISMKKILTFIGHYSTVGCTHKRGLHKRGNSFLLGFFSDD